MCNTLVVQERTTERNGTMLKVISNGFVYTGDVVDVMDTETGELYPNGILGSTWVDETGIYEGKEIGYIRFPDNGTHCVAML